MTREHLFFIPFIFALGFVVGALATRARPPEVPSATNGRPVLLAGLLVFVVFIATHALSLHGGARHTEHLLAGQALFDQRPSFSADELYRRIASFGAAGREAYGRMTYTSDVVFPLALFYFLVRLARYVARSAVPRSALALALATLVPILWLAADLAENAMVYTLLGKFPERHETLAATLGFVTDAKFTLLVASVAVPAVLLRVGATGGRGYWGSGLLGVGRKVT
jgi:hypothetical protein